MGKKRNSKRKKKQAQAKLRQQTRTAPPWWQSKAAAPWRISGAIISASGALLLIGLLVSGPTVSLGDQVLWTWDQARLIVGYACALTALFFGFGAYKGELIARLGSALLAVCIAGAIVMVGLTNELWVLLGAGILASFVAAVMAYLLALWQPK